MIATDRQVTRRNILVGVTASLICAPAIVRASSLMLVSGVPLQILSLELKTPGTLGEWYQLCFYNNLDNALKAGRAMTYAQIGGNAILVAEGHRIVADARAQGWLAPQSTVGRPANAPPVKKGASVSGL
jgi:hypothetical protein